MYCRFYQGTELGGLIAESRKALAFSRSRLNQWAIDLLKGGLRVFTSLADSSSAECESAEFGPECLTDSDYLAEVDANQNIQITCIYKILTTFYFLLHGRYGEALDMSNQVEPILYTVGMQGLRPWPEHAFARLLILTALPPDRDERREAERRGELGRILAQLHIWADHCPENFEHQYRLAAAEMARLDQRPTEAMSLYEDAIDAARAEGFVQWEGVANERAARFWQARGNGRMAQMYWQQAYACYARWGATAKLQQMESEYRQWLETDLPRPPNPSDFVAEHVRNGLLEKQLQLLRIQTVSVAEARMRLELERLASELAPATEHLRAEVAERKRVEEALRESEERHKGTSRMMDLALEMATAGVWDLDLESDKLVWNNAYVRLLELEPDVIPTLEKFLALVHPDDREVLKADIQHSIQNPASPFQVRFRVVLPSGVHWMERRGQVLCDASGKPVRMIGVTADVTEQKRADDALRDSEERYRTILQAAINGFWRVDLQGRLLEVNEASCRMSGYSEEELLRMGLSDLIKPERRGEIAALMSQVIAQGGDRFESQLRRKDGSILEVEVSVQHRTTDGGCFVAFLQDVTKRRRAEQALQSSEQKFRQLAENISQVFWMRHPTATETLSLVSG